MTAISTQATAGAPAAATSTLDLAGVSRWYGNVVAVNDVTMRLGPGVTGLLGPNGAGKTTLLHMMAGFLSTSRGTVTLDGEPTWRNPAVYRRLGLVSEREAVHGFLTAYEFVLASAKLHRLPDPEAATRRAIDLVEMTPAQDRRIDTYSKGMRQRTRVAYQTQGITWWADYNVTFAEAARGECKLDVGAWVSIINTSGASYHDAKLKLVAGEVHRAPASVVGRMSVAKEQRALASSAVVDGFAAKSRHSKAARGGAARLRARPPTFRSMSGSLIVSTVAAPSPESVIFLLFLDG